MALAAQEIFVWQASPADALAPELLAALDREEIARAERFSHARRRQAFLVARTMLRHVLAGELGADPAALRFDTGPHGKPSLTGDGPLQFNLSHSGDVVVLALARSDVGVDIEQLRPGVDHAALAKRFFSSREQRQLARLDPGRRHRAFFAIWTRKEALLKAWGVGLSLTLASFDVSVSTSVPPEVLDVRRGPGVGRRWSLLDLDVGPGYAGALAHAGPPGQFQLRRWTSRPYG